MFDGFLALDGKPDIVMPLEIDKSFQIVLLGEAVGHAFAVLPGATYKIGSDADIQRSIRSVGHDVNPTAAYDGSIAIVDARIKSAHDGKNNCIPLYCIWRHD